VLSYGTSARLRQRDHRRSIPLLAACGLAISVMPDDDAFAVPVGHDPMCPRNDRPVLCARGALVAFLPDLTGALAGG